MTVARLQHISPLCLGSPPPFTCFGVVGPEGPLCSTLNKWISECPLAHWPCGEICPRLWTPFIRILFFNFSMPPEQSTDTYLLSLLHAQPCQTIPPSQTTFSPIWEDFWAVLQLLGFGVVVVPLFFPGPPATYWRDLHHR
jgi:hypothetical protein